MSHYAGHGMQREPFSNSPDPSFLLATRQHSTCLQELEISLRLRRGLNVVTGDIGTGKTTLCRSLMRAFAEDRDTDVHLLLDPHFQTCEEFLRVILASVSGLSPEPDMGLWALKEALKQQLFRLGLVEKRLVILVIDEGQKISPENLEILREMLNYETNTSKLLQIVLFGQQELEPMLDAMPNLADRINVRRKLSALSFGEVRQMIEHRLAVAAGQGVPSVRFGYFAAWAIHRACKGSPRKTVRLCHMAMLEMLVRGKNRVGVSEVRAALRPDQRPARRPRKAMGLAAVAMIGVAFGALWLSLDAAGPVLGPAMNPTPLSAPEMPSAQPHVEQGTAPQAETRAASLNSEGLSLRDAEPEESRETPARVSLIPQRDQGPDLRSPVEAGKPPLLQVDSGRRETGAAQPALLTPDKAQHLAQKASFSQDR